MDQNRCLSVLNARAHTHIHTHTAVADLINQSRTSPASSRATSSSLVFIMRRIIVSGARIDRAALSLSSLTLSLCLSYFRMARAHTSIPEKPDSVAERSVARADYRSSFIIDEPPACFGDTLQSHASGRTGALTGVDGASINPIRESLMRERELASAV